MRRKITQIITIGFMATALFGSPARAIADETEKTIQVAVTTISAYETPETNQKPAFSLYYGMQIRPNGMALRPDGIWLKFRAGNRDYWIRGVENGARNFAETDDAEKKIIDSYGILSQSHRYAVKMVKQPDARGYIETYQKIGDRYVLQYSYLMTYPKEGPKSIYGDLKTIGGPTIRYMYRTTRSAMNGYDREGEKFGVYKISYPMPHDALPHFLDGAMGAAGYNKIPSINEKNGQYFPHPHSYMGADILIHTAIKGSLGCINVENEAMGFLYHKDLVIKNDREIVPVVIYDEDMEAPAAGTLF